MEVGVSGCQSSRSSVHVLVGDSVGPSAVVGSATLFRELTVLGCSLDKIGLGYGVSHAESAYYPLVL